MARVEVTGAFAAVLLTAVLAAGGARAEASTIDVALSFTGLEPLAGEHYEGWLVVNGAPVSTGTFQVSATGALQDLAGNPKSTFRVANVDLAGATKFVLSIEPAGDTDPGPAAVKPLAGDLNAARTGAALTANLGVSLAGIAGKYILATPSDGDGNETSGVWFLDLSTGSPAVGLTLPDLTGTDWVYEGWAVISGKPVTTGRFLRGGMADQGAPYSGSQATPPFPGEDFLENAPAGLTFPADLRGGKVVVSIEPAVDADPGPFQFKPLVADVAAGAADHVTYSMTDAGTTLPTGAVTVSRVDDPMGSYNALLVAGIVAVVAVIVIAAVLLRMRKPRAPA